MLKFSSKLKKIIATVLTVSIIFATTSIAMASDNKVNATSQKITDTSQAIKLIEQNFLGVNNDGTSYIDADAAMYIDPKVLDEITTGMNAVNKDILLGVLVRDKDTNVITSANDEIIPLVTIEGSYIWTWYGFDFIVDAYNAGLAATELENARDDLLAGLAVAVLLGQQYVSVGVGITVVIMNGWIKQAKLGQQTGRGASMSFTGTTSRCMLIGIYCL